MEWFEVSRQRACGLMLLGRSSFYCRSRRKEHVALKMRLRDVAMVRVRFGYPRLTVLLKREGWPVGKKLVYRLYRENWACRCAGVLVSGICKKAEYRNWLASSQLISFQENAEISRPQPVECCLRLASLSERLHFHPASYMTSDVLCLFSRTLGMNSFVRR
jgi:hypothetical protein